MWSVPLMVALAVSSPAQALEGNDYLYLTMADGLRVKGWYYGAKDGVLTLSGEGRLVDVPVPAIAGVVKNGQPWPLSELLADVSRLQAVEDAWRADPPPHPPGWVVATGDLVCCGLGHAALGDRRSVAVYAVADAIFLGTAAWAVVDGPGWGLAVPVVGLDLLFRGYAAGEGVRETQRRRARLGLREPRRAEEALPRTTLSTGLTESPDDE